MTDDKLWSARHARALSQARQDRGVEPTRFAPQNAISLRQLKELETEGCASFYSERIKFDVGTRLLRKLGVTLEPLPSPEPAPQPPPPPSAPAAMTARAAIEARPPASPGPATPAVSRSSRGTRAALWTAGALALMTAGILVVQPWQAPADGAMPAPDAPAAAATAAAAIATGSSAMPASADASEVVAASAPQALDSAAPAAQRQDAAASLCRFTGQGWSFTPTLPARTGDYVYLQAQQETRLCIVDATGRETALTLAAGQGANITGQPPFKLAAVPGEQVQVFYQGQRVAWQADAAYVVLNRAAGQPQP